MHIAYLINQYPKVSHSFIRREILALENENMTIMRIALRGWDEALVDVQDRAERARTRYVLQAGGRNLLTTVARMCLRRPIRFIRALRLACRMARHSDRPPLIHLIYLAEACRIECWLAASHIQHLHAHFGTNSAEVAMLVHALGGRSWSFTVHGPEEFDKAALIHLAEKIRSCLFVVAISSYARSQLYRQVSSPYWPKIQVVHCGLDQSFLSVPIIPPPSARQLVCVGRLCEQKGQLLLIEAVHRLAADKYDFRLVLVGDGELRADIEALIVRYGLLDKVHITGWISEEKVREEILAARGMVLPSFAEGLPVVLMEAMALGRPVITTYVAGIPELVRDGEHGWLVPAGDVDALARAMRACLDAPDDLLSRVGEAGRKQVSREYDVAKEAQKLRALFPQMTGGHVL